MLEFTKKLTSVIISALLMFALLTTASASENYKTWTENWNYSHEEIKLVAEQAKGKANPMAYLNKIMASLSSSNIHGEKKIKEHLEKTPVTYESALATKKPDFETRDYTPEELNSVFDSLKDVEL